ncbi:MAG: signal peptidase I [Planctomycetaceae bacterium]|nr:signal peptidase I [Planctomycetaceae bacterium]|tara:strand:+ start:2926 stop:5013 length:2088 start_codon:yes stop_codon:yes gene_type:complete
MINNSKVGDIRDMLEGFAIAIILAFIFRGFVVEAFIIPTGSMAHGLQGTHIEHECHNCKYRYRAGASTENNGQGEVIATVCPMCGFTEVLDKQNDLSKNAFSGDRILVNKFAYMFNDPNRWDVIVFKNPTNATENYIKRLVGLPNEKVLISNGDVYSKPLTSTDAVYEICRKPARKQLAIMQLVHDTKYRPKNLDEIMWPQPWRMVGTYEDGYHPLQQEGTPGNWKHTINGFNYSIDGTNREKVSIRYHHNIPDQTFWVTHNQLKAHLKAAESGLQKEKAREIREAMKTLFWPRPKLITDVYAYNTTITKQMLESYQGDNLFAPSIEDDVIEGAESDLSGHPSVSVSYESDYLSKFRTLMQGAKIAPESTTRGLAQLLRTTWPGGSARGQYWVGDLAVEFDVIIESDSGRLGFDIVEAGVHYEAEIDVETGKIALSINGGAEYFIASEAEEKTGFKGPVVEGQTAIRGQGIHTIRYSNFDNELRVWVDDDLIELNHPATFVTEKILGPKWSEEDPGDLLPIGLHSTGLAVTLENARVFRDVYYIASQDSGAVGREYHTDILPRSDETRRLIQSYWDDLRRVDPIWLNPDTNNATQQSVIQLHLDLFPSWNKSSFFTDRKQLSFNVLEDEFFPMGDNSPASADARWTRWTDLLGKNTFNRKLFIGEALMIYWPHPHGDPLLELPFIPNFSRIGVIQ